MPTTTTTIRIDPDLRARVAAAAKRAGKTTHGFIMDAIARTVEEAELDDEFHRLADDRWGTFLANGKSVPWEEARKYLLARARGERPARPRARKIGR
ncbi:MAG TPA: DUF1778 domain-containing protein [Burkholderiaceae bacterium]|jgi:predicted transcriptional regulator|nr:DUF1778 domain-containing protein [Burkholderiaceae bacterium]